jgi:hypothetical protein
MKNAIFRDVMQSGSGKNRHSEKHIASIIRVKRISELGTLAVTSYWSTLWRNSCYLLITLLLACRFFSPCWWWQYLPKHPFLQESHNVTSKKTVFFTVTSWKPQIINTCTVCVVLVSTALVKMHKNATISLKINNFVGWGTKLQASRLWVWVN